MELDGRHKKMNLMSVTGGNGWFDFLNCETVTLASVCQTRYLSSPVMQKAKDRR